MRALVISDTHFGAWTGEDLLRERQSLDVLAPHLDDIDEVVVLGDLFDLLFARARDAFGAAGGLLDLLRDKLQGKRLVFVAGNHDHHVITREAEVELELELATGETPERARERLDEHSYFRRFLARRLEGVAVEHRYPVYVFGGVLCTHGHYLDPHARRSGSLGSRLLGRAIWRIALGGRGLPRTLADYEAVITLLTEELYTLAQLPHGTQAQRNVYAWAQRLGAVARALKSPGSLVGAIASRLGSALGPRAVSPASAPAANGPDSGRQYREALAREVKRRAAVGAPGNPLDTSYPLARMVAPSDPREHALEAFDRVVHTLGWDREARQIVFAHTHQPVADVTVPGSSVRYWNTGSWIYEPDLSSAQAYLGYLRRAWPGSVVIIDTDEPQPQLLELRRHLNPLFAEAK